MTLPDHLSGQSLRQPVNFRHQLTYTLPAIPVYLLLGPLSVINGVYAKYFGLSLTSIATILLICRLFDAISDPMIGYWSDRYCSQTGSRKLFVMTGSLLLVISCYFLYKPSEGNVSAVYFLLCLLAWYFAFTFFEIPHLSWGTELVADSKGKTVLFGLRTVGANIGLLLFYLVPFLPIFTSTSYTPETLHWVVLTATVLMLPSLWFCYRFTPNGYKNSNVNHANTWSIRKEILSNKVLIIFLLGFFIYGIGLGIWFSLQFIFIDAYLGLGEHFALVNIIGLCASSVFIGFWVKLSGLIGKKETCCIGIMLYALSILVASQLSPDNASLMSLVWIMLPYYFGIAAVGVLAISLLADIIDYSAWKFGTNRAAIYFALLMFTNKTTGALGSALGLGVAGWYGFDPAAVSHAPEQVFGLRLAAFWLPIPVLLVTLVCVALIPMNDHRHRIVRRRLDARAIRSSQPAHQIPPKCSVISKDVALAN